VKLVTLLVQCRAEINGQDEVGNTPLHLLALNSKNIDLAEHLLANGADPNVANNVKHTPLQYATTPGERTIFAMSCCVLSSSTAACVKYYC
jgi:ankyrin repeat protein